MKYRIVDQYCPDRQGFYFTVEVERQYTNRIDWITGVRLPTAHYWDTIGYFTTEKAATEFVTRLTRGPRVVKEGTIP